MITSHTTILLATTNTTDIKLEQKHFHYSFPKAKTLIKKDDGKVFKHIFRKLITEFACMIHKAYMVVIMTISITILYNTHGQVSFNWIFSTCGTVLSTSLDILNFNLTKY